MMRIFSILMLIIFTSNLSLACSCAGQPDFCLTMTGIAPPDLLVKGVKKANYYYGMEFQITEVLLGEEDRELVTVWGDNGALCRVYTSGFGLEDTLILGLHHTDMAGNWIWNSAYPPDLEEEGDYHLSVCGVYYLLVEDGWVSEPPFIQDPFHMTYEDFKELECLTTGISGISESAVRISPNPASEFVTIQFQNGSEDIEEVLIYNILGGLVSRSIIGSGTTELSLPTHSLPSGTYLLVLSDGIHRLTRKFVVLSTDG